MQYRRLGRSGCKVSVISLGSWLTYGCALDQGTTNACVRAALDQGINLFDTADIYASGRAEEALGKALKGIGRERVVLATKVFFPMSDAINNRGLSRKHIMEACHASLRRLGVDTIDLYQCHCPDNEVPIEEVVCAMEDLIRQGKVLYWGVSNWNAAAIIEACAVADQRSAYRPISNQPRYSLLDRCIEFEVLPVSQRCGLGQIVYSPLAQGVLTGKYTGRKVPKGSRAADESRNGELHHFFSDRHLELAARIADLARQTGVDPAQFALAAVLARDGIASAIIGASRAEQVVNNAAAADLRLPGEVLAMLDEWTRPG